MGLRGPIVQIAQIGKFCQAQKTIFQRKLRRPLLFQRHDVRTEDHGKVFVKGTKCLGRTGMKSNIQPPAIRKVVTLGLIASMSAGILLSGSTTAQLNSGNRRAAAQPASLTAARYPNLRRFGINLTKLARLGKLEAVKRLRC
jgi:hypothetical protein